MTSYIELVNKIQAFCDAHLQIQRFDAEFNEQRPNLATDSEKYPYVFMSPVTGTPNYDLNNITVEITCYDIIQKDRANLNTIVSDCHLILTDLFSYYNQGNDSDIIALSATQTPLNNLDLDYVAGWSMQITFELEGWCTDAIPMSPIPSGGGGACEVATYTITDDEGTTLYSGTIASGGDLTQVISDATATLKDTSGVTISTTSINAQGSADITAPDASYSNSSATYSGNILSGGSLSLPDEDIVVTDENDNVLQTITNPVYDNLTIDLASFCPECDPAPVGATLMKTGQTTSYRTGDDGDIEAGRATDFFTLAVNNPFGNTNRFTDELGGQTYTNDIAIDWTTYDTVTGKVLGYYYGDVMTNRDFNASVDWGFGLSIGTFTSGWRLANIREIQNLSQFSVTPLLNYAPFNLNFNAGFGSSTTRPNYTNTWYIYLTDTGHTIAVTKTATYRTIATRDFTVTGTTLT